MTVRVDIATKVQVGNRPYSFYLLTNPTIEDILSLEMRLYAGELQAGSIDPERRVDRDIRDFLIKIGMAT